MLLQWCPVDTTPSGGGIDCTTGEFTAQYGIRNIDNLTGSCDYEDDPSCPFKCLNQPSDIYYRSGATLSSNLDLQTLVDDAYKPIPTNNPKNWWIECGWSSNNFCVDDDNPGMINSNRQCLDFTGIPNQCSVTFWIQVVSECDDCVRVNGFPQVGGTWWKWLKNVAPDEYPQNCNIDPKGQVTLTLQTLRTDCGDMDKAWGCGPNESRD
jgi:hypothetical protein